MSFCLILIAIISVGKIHLDDNRNRYDFELTRSRLPSISLSSLSLDLNAAPNYLNCSSDSSLKLNGELIQCNTDRQGLRRWSLKLNANEIKRRFSLLFQAQAQPRPHRQLGRKRGARKTFIDY